ncbi:MAG: pyridoxal phosphate-dependent aminotransferase [Lentisphaeria bacterium]|nr:pyridoxal phosphate-dependent aminotransferase [Lentisphaeria bacterium]
MQLLAAKIDRFLETSSWIRRMFEAGIELKRIHGPERVYDFSLGNPDLPPPPEVAAALHELADHLSQPPGLGYMPNAGYPEARERLAESLAREQKTPGLRGRHVVLTCGAAGGINAFFRAVLSPGDEVVCPAPYFVEYGFYADNAGAALKPVPARPGSFELDLDALDQSITADTRIVLVNSPNNPTGAVYSQGVLEGLAEILGRACRRHGRPVFLVSDEPYRFLTYDGVTVPPVLPLVPFSVVIGSFSKNLGLAGERVGYVAVNPEMPGEDRLVAGLVMTNRILGFVNAPAIGQRVMTAALGSEVDAGVYRRRRAVMADVLSQAGITFPMPKGAFYFFPRTPGGMDDTAFVDLLMRQRILAVPGSGFGCPGHFRLTFCVDERVIEASAEGFRSAVAAARAQGAD